MAEMYKDSVYYFYRSSSWGWATWKRVWALFEPDVRVLLKKLRWKKNDFNIGGTGPFYSHLYCHKVGEVDTWAARFYASSFLANKLVLYPGHTMAIQSGMDGSGTHSRNTNVLSEMKVCQTPINVSVLPVTEDKNMYNAFSRYYGQGKKSNIKYIYRRLKSFIRRLIGIDYK